MQKDAKIAAAKFDPRMWSLELTDITGETMDLDLTKYDGFGLDGAALERVEICACGSMVWFPDFPAPGAMIAFEDLDPAA